MPKTKGEQVRTTLDLPADLWRALKMRAVDERRPLREIVISAATAYLKTPVKPGR